MVCCTYFRLEIQSSFINILFNLILTLKGYDAFLVNKLFSMSDQKRRKLCWVWTTLQIRRSWLLRTLTWQNRFVRSGDSGGFSALCDVVMTCKILHFIGSSAMLQFALLSINSLYVSNCTNQKSYNRSQSVALISCQIRPAFRPPSREMRQSVGYSSLQIAFDFNFM